MGKLMVKDDAITVYTSSDEEIVVEIHHNHGFKEAKVLDTLSSGALATEYKWCYRNHMPRRMGIIVDILHHRGQDIYVRKGKVYWLTYNGCEPKVKKV